MSVSTLIPDSPSPLISQGAYKSYPWRIDFARYEARTSTLHFWIPPHGDHYTFTFTGPGRPRDQWYCLSEFGGLALLAFSDVKGWNMGLYRFHPASYAGEAARCTERHLAIPVFVDAIPEIQLDEHLGIIYSRFQGALYAWYYA